MTQQPFSRPGAIDLSGLKRPAQPPPGAAADRRAAGADRARGGGGSAYAVDVDEQNFQAAARGLDDRARACWSSTPPSQAPESATMAADVATVAGEYDGRFLAGLIDIDASPAIAQAMQIPQVPMLFVLLDGRPATQPIPGLISLEELRTLFNQLGQQLTAQGITGRHQPRSAGPADAARPRTPEEPFVDPRYAAAQDALGEGDIDRAVAEYQKLVDGNPADTEAAAGLAMAKVLQRTQGVDLQAARAAAAASPDDVDAQTLVADLDMLGGHVDDAFNRLIDAGAPYVRRRPQQGPRAPARPVRRRRQRRPAGPQGPAEPRVGACSESVHDLERRSASGRAAGLQPRDRHPERRAGDVVQADRVEEVDRGGVAAVLAADAELEVGVDLAAGLAGASGPGRRRPRCRATRTARPGRSPARGRWRRTTPRRRRARSPTSSGSGRWCRTRRSRPTRRSCRR